MKPRLTLLGAGPGDPELITVKGVRILENAQVVLYDALVCTSLLDYAKNAEVIRFVGKRRRFKAMSQGELNQLIVDLAREFGHVVRLKGGDPFVFARGYEELAFATDQGLEVEVVPGVSSALASTAKSGFPLTHRSLSSSIHIYSGTKITGELNEELKRDLEKNGTKVVLMGFHQLQQIVDAYFKKNLPDTPIAVIQNGTKDNEKTALGTMKNIIRKVREKEMGTPAIIYIGEVVGLIAEGFETYTAMHTTNS